MSSFFAFYRARGVPGAYVVGIQLDLLPTESVQVYCGQNLQHPTRKTQNIQEGGQRELYRIAQITLGNAIYIQIQDKQLLPFQRTMYTATLDGFTITDVTYILQQPYGIRHD